MARRKTTRRQFLRGRSAAEELADLAQGPNSSGKGTSGPGAAGDTPAAALDLGKGATSEFQFHATHRAMACEFELTLGAGCWGEACEYALLALDNLDSLEEMMTTFCPESEMSRINASAAQSPQPVSAALFDLFTEGLHLYEITDGAFDMTAGPLSRVWGFHRRKGRLPEDAELRQAIASVGSNHIELDRDNQTIFFRQPGLEIDLGAIGKGYALDYSARQLIDNYVDHFLFHGGNSSVLTRGSDDLADPESRWQIGLPHPLKPDVRLGQMTIDNCALGTSGSARQFFYHRGRRYGHVLDPRTGRPVENILAVTILAPTATLADALATALFVMGPDATEKFCKEHPEISALFVLPGERRESTDLVSINLPEGVWQPA